MSFHCLNDGGHAIASRIAKQAIFAFLAGAVLLNVAVLVDIVKRPVKERRRLIHYRVNARVAIDQNQIGRLFMLAVKLANPTLALCP